MNTLREEESDEEEPVILPSFADLLASVTKNRSTARKSYNSKYVPVNRGSSGYQSIDTRNLLLKKKSPEENSNSSVSRCLLKSEEMLNSVRKENIGCSPALDFATISRTSFSRRDTDLSGPLSVVNEAQGTNDSVDVGQNRPLVFAKMGRSVSTPEISCCRILLPGITCSEVGEKKPSDLQVDAEILQNDRPSQAEQDALSRPGCSLSAEMTPLQKSPLVEVKPFTSILQKSSGIDRPCPFLRKPVSSTKPKTRLIGSTLRDVSNTVKNQLLCKQRVEDECQEQINSEDLQKNGDFLPDSVISAMATKSNQSCGNDFTDSTSVGIRNLPIQKLSLCTLPGPQVSSTYSSSGSHASRTYSSSGSHGSRTYSSSASQPAPRHPKFKSPPLKCNTIQCQTFKMQIPTPTDSVPASVMASSTLPLAANSSDSNSKEKWDKIIVNDKEYFKLRIIGRGGSCKVFEALDLESRLVVAIKVVDLEGLGEDILKAYANEIQLLQKLQWSEYIVKLMQFEQTSSDIKLVLEKGSEDLLSIINDAKKKGKTMFDQAPFSIKHYWQEMLLAVQDIHEEGIAHSDLKPANFLLVNHKLKLIDFGIAFSIQKDMTSIITDAQGGTFNYMSPESFIDINTGPINTSNSSVPMVKISVKSDVWSLGCILYSLVYGVTPFQHITRTVDKLKAISDPRTLIDFPPIHDLNLVDAMQKCLRYDPRQRPSIQELLQHPYLKEDETKTNPNKMMKKMLDSIAALTPQSLQRASSMLQNMNHEK